eukprot:SAG11_NODE_1720_length_4377_cov_5.551426_2_plen_71_part_00
MPPTSAPPAGNEKSCVAIQTLKRRKEEAVHRSERVHTCETRVKVVQHTAIDQVVALIKVITDVAAEPRLI